MSDHVEGAHDPENGHATNPGSDPEPAENPADAAAPVIPEDDGSGLRAVAEIKKPSTVGGIIYLVVLAAALVGVGVAASGAWRTGVSWLGLSLLAAAGARLALRNEDAGMLQVRRKTMDATILVVLGGALLVLAATIPEQPN